MNNLKCGYLLGTMAIVLLPLLDIISVWSLYIYKNPIFENQLAILAIPIATSLIILLMWCCLFYFPIVNNKRILAVLFVILSVALLSSKKVYSPILLTTHASEIEDKYYSDLQHTLKTTVARIEETASAFDELEQSSTNALATLGYPSEYPYNALQDDISTANLDFEIRNVRPTASLEELKSLIGKINDLVQKLSNFIPYNTIAVYGIYKYSLSESPSENIRDNISQIRQQIPEKVSLEKITPFNFPFDRADLRFILLLLFFVAHFVSPALLQILKHRDIPGKLLKEARASTT